MNRFCFQATSIAAKSCRGIRAATSVPYHHNPESNATLIEHFRSSWPDVIKDVPLEYQTDLPHRTVPDDKLRFSFTSTFDQGSSFFHQHLEGNPADFKVKMKVYMRDMNLSVTERAIFARLVGPRLNVGNAELKLTCSKFPNKLENKKYVILLLENLIAEAKRLAQVEDKYIMPKAKAPKGEAAPKEA